MDNNTPTITPNAPALPEPVPGQEVPGQVPRAGYKYTKQDGLVRVPNVGAQTDMFMPPGNDLPIV